MKTNFIQFRPKLRRRVGCKWLVTCEDFAESAKNVARKTRGRVDRGSSLITSNLLRTARSPLRPRSCSQNVVLPRTTFRHLGNAQSPYGKARSFFRRNSADSGHGHTQPKDGESLVATFYAVSASAIRKPGGAISQEMHSRRWASSQSPAVAGLTKMTLSLRRASPPGRTVNTRGTPSKQPMMRPARHTSQTALTHHTPTRVPPTDHEPFVRLLAKSSSELVLTTSNDAPKSGSGTAAYGCPVHGRPITVSVHKVRACCLPIQELMWWRRTCSRLSLNPKERKCA
jgi:hypothetical protein